MSQPANKTIEIPIETYQKLCQLEDSLAEASAERDLYREAWLRLKKEIAMFTMSEKECEELRLHGIDGDALMAELEEILK